MRAPTRTRALHNKHYNSSPVYTFLHRNETDCSLTCWVFVIQRRERYFVVILAVAVSVVRLVGPVHCNVARMVTGESSPD